MGIQYLTALVNKQNGLLQDELFGAERLVIDAPNLLYKLYFDAGLDQNHGGEYGAFKDLVVEFIGVLRECKISPYMVFDGCADFPDEKWDTGKDKAKQSVAKAHEAATSGKNMGILPTLIYVVFRQTLERLEVPTACCYTEADRQAASLAHEWNCPVLSDDSDFFIFPMKEGMLPTAHFRWKEVQQRNGQKYIPCKRYHSSRFCQTFSISPPQLPVFAVLAGNDYTKNMAGIGGMRPTQQQRAPYMKLQDLIKSISRFRAAGPREVLVEFLRDVPSRDKEQMIRSLQEKADNYSLPPSPLSSFFEKGTLPPLPPQMEGVVPGWMKGPVAEASFTPDFLDVLTDQRVGLGVVVDHKDKPSAKQVSLPLRRLLYGLLLGRDRKVMERDRDGLNVIVYEVQTESPQLSLQSLPKVAVEQRRQMLLKALGVDDLGALPSRLTFLALPLAATCYWLTETAPPLDLLKVLLIGLCRGDTLRQATAVSPQALDLDWCHRLNQWQSCLHDAFLLNQLLGEPLLEPDMARLFSGTLVHDLLHKMKRGRLDESLRSYMSDDGDFNVVLHIARQSQSGNPASGRTTDPQPSSSGQVTKRPDPTAKPSNMDPSKKFKKYSQ